ncbi:MAG: radical SAM protein [Oscillospiraceae bacterium]|nr:radical SAM protein [Oscillospiraceae bacterium]
MLSILHCAPSNQFKKQKEGLPVANYKEISCACALNNVHGRFPYNWDLNIYRGCEHGCKYCFAMYSHQYLGSEQYFSDIFIKTNVVERLEKQLSSPSWKGGIINIGGVTDSYQPIEAEYKLMPEILRLLIKYKNPCIISTKSDLILRDYELIEELSKLTYVNIAATITCMDESVRQKIEPNGAPSLRRFAMLKEFSKTEASIGLHLMPIIPFLTDARDNINSLLSIAKDNGVKYFIPAILNLRGRTRWAFFDFIRAEYPALCKPFQELYKTGGVDKTYKHELYTLINELKTKHELSTNYGSIIKEKLRKTEFTQLSLFD